MFRYFHTILLLSLSFVVFSGSIAKAEPPASPEYLVKAAYLYNFTRFVEWPSDVFKNSSTPIHLCILGVNPFGPALDSIRSKTVQGRKLSIKHVNRVEEIFPCHLLFISASEKDNLKSILNTIKKSSILTVSEIKGFPQQGGIINFIVVENKIRFEINLGAAEQNGLKVSSQLLKLANIVRSEPRKDRQ